MEKLGEAAEEQNSLRSEKKRKPQNATKSQLLETV